MSKYTEELRLQFPNTKDIKRITKEILENEELAFKSYHKEESYERLKKKIKGGCKHG